MLYMSRVNRSGSCLASCVSYQMIVNDDEAKVVNGLSVDNESAKPRVVNSLSDNESDEAKKSSQRSEQII